MRRCITILLIIYLSGCIEEDYFGLSNATNILSIEVSNQASPARIKKQEKQVIIEFPPGLDLSAIQLKTLSLSSFARANRLPGDLLDFNLPVDIIITAEDGSSATWTLVAEVASLTPQLDNSDFNLWYKTSAGYFEPGSSAETTIWGTGNPGTALLGIYATTPLELADDNFAVRMETLDNGRLPASLGFPISAATIYTGKFNPDNLDPTDPKAAIDFGTPFIGRPEAFRIEYSYQPGSTNRDKNGNPLSFGDQCDIYIFLEVRTNNDVMRLATAWFRSDQNQPDLTELNIPFVYGELDNTYPATIKPANGKYVSQDSIDFILPTHLTFVATSSFDGDNFAGAVGSTLIVDNLVLEY